MPPVVPSRDSGEDVSSAPARTGAVRAMRLAVSAGGDVAENEAYVRSLLGGLELQRGRLGAARRQFRAALNSMPGYAAASAGQGRAWLPCERPQLGECQQQRPSTHRPAPSAPKSVA